MLRTGWSPLLLLQLIIACAPPPAVLTADTDSPPTPSVRIVVPPLSPQPEIGLAANCDLAFDVVVDVDNYTYVSPGVESENVEGHGHFHINGGVGTPIDGYYVAPKAQLAYLDITDTDLQNVSGSADAHFSDYAGTDQVFSIVVSAQTNTHEPIDTLIDCPTCRSTLEFTIGLGDCVVE